MTTNNMFTEARNELNRISQHINACSSCATCEAQYPIDALLELVNLIEHRIGTRSPARRALMGAVLSGLNIDSVSTGSPTPPGEVLTESMKAMGMTVKRLAELTGYSEKHIVCLRASTVLPSHRCSLALQQAGLGEAGTWNRLASEYRGWLWQKENT